MEDLFQKYILEKRRFVVRAVIFVVFFYFSLPLLLIFFPTFMNIKTPIIGISLAWLYAFLQFGMTWILGWTYFRKAARWDRYIDQMDRE